MRPVPPGGQFDYVTAPDGARLRYGTWPGAAGRPTILLLPGLRESIEKHFETVEDLQARGFAVVALDWRSQGLSTRPLENPQKVHVDNFDCHVSDLQALVTEILQSVAPADIYVLAHSMGAHNALRWMHDHPGRVRGAILCSPMCDIWLPQGLRWFFTAWVRLMTWLGRGEDYIFFRGDYDASARRFDGNRLTSDRDRFEEEKAQIDANPALQTGGPTWGWLRAARRSVTTLMQPDYLSAITTPILMLQAGVEGVVRNEAQDIAAALLPDCQFLRIDGARHELLRERDIYRDQALAALDDFIY